MNSRLSQGPWALMGALLVSGCVVAPPMARVAPPVPAAAVAAAPMYFYPERGQDAPRQDRDRYECYRWAAAQSGFDPGMTPVSLPPPSAAPTRDGADVAAGAITGAMAGAVLSSPRHTRESVVIGALFGAALGAMAQESRAQAADQALAARQAALAPLEGFRRAMSACMSGRGYRVG